MNFNLQTAIIMILCLNIVLFVGGVRVIEDTNTLNRFIDVNSYSNNDTISVSDSFKGSVPTSYESTGETSGLNFIDSIRAVTGFLSFMVNIIFTPIGLFASLPPIAGLIIGLPLLVAGVVSLIYFIRSGK